MCRLFGLMAGQQRVHATFWLLDAPDSLQRQSHHNPDGTGLGTFDPSGRPVIEKQPLPAFDDPSFAVEAKDRASSVFVAHVRHASTGARSVENTHPFALDGRIFAHNGVVQGLDKLEAHLGSDLALVQGDTDSERVFALITREIRRAGSVARGVVAAVRWVADELPVYALNFVLAEPMALWALRYPATNTLYLLERNDPGGALDHNSASGTRVISKDLATKPSVVVASEPLDANPGWQPIPSGVLVRIDQDLAVHREVILPDAPARPLVLGDLAPQAAASQQGNAPHPPPP